MYFLLFEFARILRHELTDDRVTDLLVELNVSEYGVNAPRLAEHGAE